ncbi:aspartate--tRNA ligase [Candidatus Woesearchaeota archaeon]|nr:aspartate--tRNA ligase [Candidatus Woesearchaeota archaeon]
MLRTHTCGELRMSDDTKIVSLCGWTHSRRDHGGIIFIDLRDRYGLTQVVFDPSHNKAAHQEGEKLRREDVIRITGKVRPRGPDLENPKLATGQIEVLIDQFEMIGKADTPPIEIDDHKPASEEMRMKYRYLDLRRPSMINNFIVRHKAAQSARNFLSNNKFIEVETPLLIKSTPEGARDYVVPSRVHPGKFYALPQSPQLYKQILMVSGFDRYFQLAKCLRDEDMRADRQPEFTQIDLEMSFVHEEDVFKIIEGLLRQMWKEAVNINIQTPFIRLPYEEALDRFGSDKPDLRFGMELINLNDAVKGSSFGVFNSILEHSGLIKCIVVPKDLSRKDIDELTQFAMQFGAKGLAWMKRTEKGFESSIVKFFSNDILQKIQDKTQAKAGETLLFVADKSAIANDVLARLRNRLGKELSLYDEKVLKFCWIVDFPLFEWNDDEGKWDTKHHMFCAPKAEHIPFLKSDPGKVYATLYDVVLNGTELGSGSIRISDPKLQEDVMSVVGYPKREAERRFGFLLEAYKYGGPTHGGIALGFDRLVALMLSLDDIREVVAFPKTKSAECLMDNSPSEITEKEFKELSIKVDVARKRVTSRAEGEG